MGGQDHSRRNRSLDGRTGKIVRGAIDEARMVRPGIQTLFGFQLVAVLNERFAHLSESEQLIHFAATILVAIAIALIMTPAAYHRLAEQASVSAFFVKLTSALIAAAMAPLMIGLAFEVYLLGCIILGGQKASLAIAAALLAIFSFPWFAFPLYMRRFGSPD